MTLDDISKTLNPQTDKGSGDIMYHNYLVKYEQYVAPIKDSVKKLLEVGVADGGSMLLWAQYFPNAYIYGVELFHRKIVECMKFVDTNRFTFFNGDYTNPSVMSGIKFGIGYDLDIIVDDGCHSIESQVIAVKALGKHLSKDGYYFLEDILIQNKPHIDSVLEEADLEFVDDYCDPAYIPNSHGEHHLFILRRKR